MHLQFTPGSFAFVLVSAVCDSGDRRVIRSLALVLTLLTGFSGLVYEVAWQKYLSTLLGSQSQATAAVLGIFLGGLSVGYAVFASVTRRSIAGASADAGAAPLLRLYGFVEGGIGIYGLLFPLLFRGILALSGVLSHEAGGVSFAIDVLLTIALIGTPTVLMGGTIPILTQALARSLADATRFHALIYTFNTAGAFLGALAAGFVLVDGLGLDGTVRWMGVINLIAGGAFLVLGARPGAHVAPAVKPEALAPQREGISARRGSRRDDKGVSAVAAGAASARPGAIAGFAWFGASAALSGFAMMCIQTVLNRLGALAFGASQFTFSMVVAVFVLCIALGSLVVSALPRIPRGSVVVAQAALVLLLLAMYGQLENAPYFAHAVRALFRDTDAAFFPYHLAAFGLLLAVFAVPIGLSGALLPLLFHELRHEVADLGEVAGRLYSWNTVGSLFGALIGGWILLYWLDLHHIYRIALVALALAGFLLAIRLLPFAGAATAGVALVVAAFTVMSLDAWSPERLTCGVFRLRAPGEHSFAGPAEFFENYELPHLVFHDDDPTASVVVRDDEEEGVSQRAIVTNGKPDTRIPQELETVILLGAVPCLLAQGCENAFVIGLGTGATAGTLANLDEMKKVVVAEISSGVHAALPLFSFANGGAAENPKIEIRNTDAYRALMRDRGQYDVIVSEPSNPWVAGIENVYSQEFLQAAKSRLQPGGVYAQWFHSYESSPETLAMIIRTFSSVFGPVAMWSSLYNDFFLVGWNDATPSVDLARLESRMRRPAMTAALERAGIHSLPALLVHEFQPAGVYPAALEPGPVHTLLRPLLSHRAARDFFVDRDVSELRTANLSAAREGAKYSLLRRYEASRGGVLPAAEYVVALQEICRYRSLECATLLGHARRAVPGSTELEKLKTSLIEGGDIGTDVLAMIEQLHGGPASGVGANAEIPVLEISQITDFFERFYLHAAPFDRHVLAALWSRCADDEKGERCAFVRSEVEKKLGRLDAGIDPVR